ncbi:MAG: D-cysteine desulfhydrase family protein [Planctomycetes bacterium]|nr:D-cysteine desulfhydrase family protein [Planctomycetota bacterium]
MSSLTTEQLRARIAHLPRVSLAHLPTPLEEAPRFSRQLKGPRVWIKRDDCTGLYFGGNKTRHNEFLLADALERKADVLVWGAGVQSNNCRQTAAACNKLGLDCVLYLSRAAHNDDVQGNLLLDHLMGAEIHIIDEPLGPLLDEALLKASAELAQAGRRPYVWDRVPGRPLAAVSYALCLAEMLEQFQEKDIHPTAIYAAAAGATGAGLVLGKAILGWHGKIKLLCPILWPWDIAADLAEVANDAAKLLELPHRVTSRDVDVRTDFIGPGYGQITPAGSEAIKLIARSEGILLDPVYTAKAMAGFIHDVRHGMYKSDEIVVFMHTGGTPAVFAYRDELLGKSH